MNFQKNETEKLKFENEARKMDEKIKMIEKNLNNENERKRAELEKMRKEIGEKGGAGHFWGNDRAICDGGVRNWMEQAELEKVLRLLAVGEKKINLKESEFRAFLSQKKNGKKLKKSFILNKIATSPKLDGRCNSKLLGKIMEETAKTSGFGSAKTVKIKI